MATAATITEQSEDIDFGSWDEVSNEMTRSRRIMMLFIVHQREKGTDRVGIAA